LSRWGQRVTLTTRTTSATPIAKMGVELRRRRRAAHSCLTPHFITRVSDVVAALVINQGSQNRGVIAAFVTLLSSACAL